MGGRTHGGHCYNLANNSPLTVSANTDMKTSTTKFTPYIETTVICVSTEDQLQAERSRLEAEGFVPQRPAKEMSHGGWMQGMIKRVNTQSDDDR